MMTNFDWYVIGFIPVAVVLVLVQFILNDWDLEKMMFGEEE